MNTNAIDTTILITNDNIHAASRAYYAAKDEGAAYSEYDAFRIEWRKTSAAEAREIAQADAKARKAVKARQTIERRVVRKAVQAFIKAGYVVSLSNGDEVPVKHSASVNAVMAELQQCDEEWLYVCVATAEGKFKRVGTVCLVYGNDGWDVIADYSVTLEHVLVDVNEYADKLCA